MMKTIIEERLVIHEKHGKTQKSFFDSLPKGNIKTMVDSVKPARVKSKTILIHAYVVYVPAAPLQ